MNQTRPRSKSHSVQKYHISYHFGSSFSGPPSVWFCGIGYSPGLLWSLILTLPSLPPQGLSSLLSSVGLLSPRPHVFLSWFTSHFAGAHPTVTSWEDIREEHFLKPYILKKNFCHHIWLLIWIQLFFGEYSPLPSNFSYC